MDVLARIDELRLQRGWSVNYLAMEAGLTQSTVNNLYMRQTEPKLSTLRAICDALGVSLSDFFKENESYEDELIRTVKSLSPENKAALLQLLSMKNRD